MLAADAAITGSIPPLVSPGGMTGSIGGSVLATSAGSSCVNHSQANGVASVRVQLLDVNGALVEETTTGSQGNYRFVDLLPGQYAVRRVAEAGQSSTAHVGDGGGIVLGLNQVGEIGLQGGDQLTDYDFCQFDAMPAVAGPGDRPIVPPRDDFAAAASILAFAQSQPSTDVPLPVAEPIVTAAPTTTFDNQAPVSATRTIDFFGGSSRQLKSPKSIKTWDEFPSDDIFSTLSVLELAEAGQLHLAENHSLETTSDEAEDAAFADGYTTKTLAWHEESQTIAISDLLDGENGRELDSEDDDSSSVPKLAGVPPRRAAQ